MATMGTTSGVGGSVSPAQESSKLVFVFLRGAQPKRKVALAIKDAMSWSAFIAQVERKLRVPAGSVTAVRYARGDTPVTSVDMLQDIDELEVESSAVDENVNGNGKANGGSVGGMDTPNWQANATSSELSSRHAAVDVGADSNDKANGSVGDANDACAEAEEDKYEKRRAGGIVGGFMRVLSPMRGGGRSKRPLLPTGNDLGGSTKQKLKPKRSRGCDYVQLGMVAFALIWIVGIYFLTLRK